MDINIKDLKNKTRDELLFLTTEHSLSEAQLKNYAMFQEVNIKRVCIMNILKNKDSIDVNTPEEWFGWLHIFKNETLYCVSGINIVPNYAGKRFFVSEDFAEQSYWASYILINKFYRKEMNITINIIHNGPVLNG